MATYRGIKPQWPTILGVTISPDRLLFLEPLLWSVTPCWMLLETSFISDCMTRFHPKAFETGKRNWQIALRTCLDDGEAWDNRGLIIVSKSSLDFFFLGNFHFQHDAEWILNVRPVQPRSTLTVLEVNLAGLLHWYSDQLSFLQPPQSQACPLFREVLYISRLEGSSEDVSDSLYSWLPNLEDGKKLRSTMDRCTANSCSRPEDPVTTKDADHCNDQFKPFDLLVDEVIGRSTDLGHDKLVVKDLRARGWVAPEEYIVEAFEPFED